MSHNGKFHKNFSILLNQIKRYKNKVNHRGAITTRKKDLSRYNYTWTNYVETHTSVSCIKSKASLHIENISMYLANWLHLQGYSYKEKWRRKKVQEKRCSKILWNFFMISWYWILRVLIHLLGLHQFQIIRKTYPLF